MKYYYHKDARTNTTKVYSLDELDKALVIELNATTKKLRALRIMEEKRAKEEHKRIMAAGICPTCYKLKPLNKICPTCD